MPESPSPIRILHLEDDQADAMLVAEILRAAGLVCDLVVVATRAAFEGALDGHSFDLILADYQLPAFDGLIAQTIASERAADVPFIFVSGTLGEEIAIERLKAGATDYVLKQRLSRLPSSVRRALGEARARREQLRSEQDLRALNAELDARVAHRTAELAAANDALAQRGRALRDSEARLQGILDHSPVVIYVKDLEGRYVLVNRRFEALVGRQAVNVLGRSDKDLFGPRLAELYRRHDEQVVATGTPGEFEEPALQDGALHIYAASKFPLRDADQRLYALCGIGVDVTARRHAEEEAKIAAREADRANHAKSEFLSRMSHDLRTPLNAILGFAQLLEAEAATSEQADNLRQILRGGQHLLELINEVLDIARIEARQLSLSSEPVAVAPVIQQIANLVRPLADQQGIRLMIEDIDCTRHVVADRQRLTQILLNLVSNALKYNRPNGTVTISCDGHHDRRCRILVTDTGYGITQNKLELLFQPFERLGAEQTTVEGTGLGLCLSKGLAEAMGGSLGVDTTIDVGSTFWLELAAADAPLMAELPREAAAVEVMAGGEDTHGTVLYIEDNASNVRLIERLLRRRPGVTLVTAGSGEAGLQLARSQVPELILLDLHLPDLHGDEVLRLLWEEPVTRPIPVVVLSADATVSQQRRLKASGAAGYLTKPFNIVEVLKTVDHYLRDAHAR